MLTINLSFSEAFAWGYSIKKGVFKNFAELAGKQLRSNFFFNKASVTLFKRVLWHRFFPSAFCKIFKSVFLWNTSGPASAQTLRNIWITNLQTNLQTNKSNKSNKSKNFEKYMNNKSTNSFLKHDQTST